MCNFEESNDFPIGILCRKKQSPETVFFHYVTISGERILPKTSFNGCDIGFSGCPECEACRDEAWQKVLSLRR